MAKNEKVEVIGIGKRRFATNGCKSLVNNGRKSKDQNINPCSF